MHPEHMKIMLSVQSQLHIQHYEEFQIIFLRITPPTINKKIKKKTPLKSSLKYKFKKI